MPSAPESVSVGKASAGRLTTHVLDTTCGRPAAGVGLTLFALDGPDRRVLLKIATNEDGRCDAPLLSGDAFKAGHYEIVFEVAQYFRAAGIKLSNPPFLDDVPIRFSLADESAHYHVPLLISPYGYSTYRGS